MIDGIHVWHEVAARNAAMHLQTQRQPHNTTSAAISRPAKPTVQAPVTSCITSTHSHTSHTFPKELYVNSGCFSRNLSTRDILGCLFQFDRKQYRYNASTPARLRARVPFRANSPEPRPVPRMLHRIDQRSFEISNADVHAVVRGRIATPWVHEVDGQARQLLAIVLKVRLQGTRTMQHTSTLSERHSWHTVAHTTAPTLSRAHMNEPLYVCTG